jgi:hypothetical protein
MRDAGGMKRRCKVLSSHPTAFSSRFSLALLAVPIALALIGSVASAKYPWAKSAGAIQGKWRATCKESAGLVIEFSMQGPDKAVGHIATLGKAGKYGYKTGEEIFRVTATDLGKWAGKLKWRSVSGTERWDPITFVVMAGQLDAVQTTDTCYKGMPRAN